MKVKGKANSQQKTSGNKEKEDARSKNKVEQKNKAPKIKKGQLKERKG